MSAGGISATQARRALSPEEKRKAAEIIAKARRAFIAALHEVGGTDPKIGRMASADLTLAMRHVEDAEDRALRHVNGGPRE